MVDEALQITVREGRGYVSGVPGDLYKELEQELSYRPAGYQYTWAFRQGKTDGWVHLLKHHKFPAGLVGRVTKFVREHNLEYELAIEDMGEKPDVQIETVGIDSRWYQDDAVEAAILNPRGVIRAPTGAGKTAIGARIIAAKKKVALVIVPTVDLLYQYRDFLTEHLKVTLPDGTEEPIGQLGDGVVDPRSVTVATIRTAAKALSVAFESYEYGEYDDKDDTKVDPKKLRDWIQSIGLLEIDEAHILGADVVFEVATSIPAPNKYGFSASPWRDDGADLKIEAATGPVIFRVPVKDLVDDGYLVRPWFRLVDTSKWWTAAAWGMVCTKCQSTTQKRDGRGQNRCADCGSDKLRSQWSDAYREEIVENDTRNQNIANIVAKLDGPTLILVKQVKHGKRFEKLIDESHFLSGKDKGEERVRVYNQLRGGNLDTVICTSIADMGLDLPILRNLVLAGGGKSSTRHLQRVGRVSRPFEGKEFAVVVDFTDFHIHTWFRNHYNARRKIEHEEWGEVAIWT